MALLILVDDTRTDSFTFGPTDWNINTLNPWFNGTGHVSPKQNTSLLSMTFNGTSVAFFGITPPANSSQILTVSIDGSVATQTSYYDTNPPSYRQWYQSPTMPEGLHNISLSHINGTSLDFAIVTAGNDTPLAGQVAIVDNENPAITFRGNWKQNQASFTSSQIPNGLPFQNTTQDSTTVGDSLTFFFTGQSAAIFGVFDWSTLGSMTLSFTLDGSELTRTFQVTSSTTQFQSRLGQQSNFEFFSYDFLTPGNHSLVVNVTDCINQTFSFDYITFQPSFSTLASMPNLTSLTTGTPNSNSSRSFPPGAIVGVIIAVIAIVGCAVLATRKWKQKKRSKDNLVSVDPFRATTTTESVPLNSRVVSSASTSNNYRPVPFADTPQTGPDVGYGERDGVEEVLPSYDESNRITIVR